MFYYGIKKENNKVICQTEVDCIADTENQYSISAEQDIDMTVVQFYNPETQEFYEAS